MKSIFEGTGVAIVTPFRNGKIDYNALEKLINMNIEKGVRAIILLGTTGEGVTINLDERYSVIKFAKRVIAGRVKLVVGTGNNNFAICKQNTIIAKELGVDGALIVTPYYNKTSQAGLVEYYKRLCGVGIPIIMYNVPSRTGLNIELDTVQELLEEDMIYGIKESTSDITRIIELSKICKNKIALYSGEDNLNYVFYALGASGAISVAANVVAEKVQEVFDLCKAGKSKDALELQNNLSELNKLLFVETNPIPIKTIMAKIGLISNEVRLPLVNITEKNERKINNYIETENLL